MIVKSVLLDGFQCGNRHYKFLGWSNSQLREYACYMFCETIRKETVDTIRSWMGVFSRIDNVAKYMSRMGQCFTQAQNTINIPPPRIMPDILGGRNPYTGQPYNFSDGIGKISPRLAKKVKLTIQIELKDLHNLQSCRSAVNFTGNGPIHRLHFKFVLLVVKAWLPLIPR